MLKILQIPIYQIDLKTHKVIKEGDKPNHSSKELNINFAEILRTANGEFKQVGGFGWKYKSKQRK